MSAAEFAEWIAFDAHDPLPDRRQDWHFAALSALMANLHATRRAGGAWTAPELRLFARAWDAPADEAARRDRLRADAAALLANARTWNERRRHER